MTDHDHPEHGHSGHDHAEHGRGAGRRTLALVLALTLTFAAVEAVGGLITGSLALLADAGHMLSDSASLALALFAFWLSSRPATPNRSFGYKRAEILAALANGVTLVAISIWIFIEAYGRLNEPPEILGGPMLAVAVAGLAVNVTGFAILTRSGSQEGESLNLQGAFRHIIADLLGSVGAIAAAIIVITTGWRYADPLISVVIGALVLASSWKLLRDSVNILLEKSPPGLDADEIGRDMVRAGGVIEVHDLHVWTITSGFPALAAHILVGPEEDCHTRRRELEGLLLEDYGIEHTTLQVDHAGDHRTHGVRFIPRSEPRRQ